MPICDKLGYERGGIRGIAQGYREMYGLESNIKNGGIPKRILLMMSVVGGLTVANLYYNQPLHLVEQHGA